MLILISMTHLCIVGMNLSRVLGASVDVALPPWNVWQVS